MGWVKKKFFERFKNFELIPCTIKFFFLTFLLSKENITCLLLRKKYSVHFFLAQIFISIIKKDVLEITVRFSFKSFGI